MAKRKGAWSIGRIIKWALLGVILVSGVLLAYLSYDIYRLRTHFPDETSFMAIRAEEAKEKGRPYKRRYQPVPFSAISTNLKNAVIVAEDGMFYQHHGFDFHEIQEAMRENEQKGRIKRGASTITQQLAKNLYLSPVRSYWRKGVEAVVTVWLEMMLDKKRILELYLNVIEWGDGIYGAEAASRAYFGIPASRLGPDQAVSLAAVIPNPRRYSVGDSRESVETRRAAIRERLGRGDKPASPASPAPAGASAPPAKKETHD